MRKVTVFYGTQIYGEYNEWQPSSSLPDGAYILDGKNWYQIRFGGASPINYSDVSKEIKMLCLLLDISI